MTHKLKLLSLLVAIAILSACASSPPEDQRYERFGEGLPTQHDETRAEPFEQEPWLPEQSRRLGDDDRDGVIDHRDQCGDHSENAKVDHQGCELILSSLRTLDLDIEFDSGSASIKSQYLDSIEQLAKLYQQNSEFVILIEGHTDSTGTRSGNMTLSKARADAVGHTLIDDFNIDKAHVLTSGVGPDEPIASNDTAAGRQKNRRMVAHLILRDRVVAKHYDIWTIELGDTESSKQRTFNTL